MHNCSGYRGATRVLTALLALSVAGVSASHSQAAPSAPPAKLELKASGEAAAEFRAGMTDFDNVNIPGAQAHFTRAVELDPSFGLARILHAGTAFGANSPERAGEIERGLADAARTSPNEMLTAMAYAEMFRGHGPSAFNLFRAAASEMPGEPSLAYRRALTSTSLPNQDFVNAQLAMRQVKNAFPNFAPVRNTMAYNLWNMGDHQGAMTEVREYVRLLPNHPNSHDSYAELLQWDGRFVEAIMHYQKAIELDPAYQAAGDGIAEAQVLMGRTDLARATLAAAEKEVPLPGDPGRHRRMAATYLIDGNAKAAMSELSLALEATPAALGLHNTMAMTDLWLGDGKTAASHATAARGGNPNVAQVAAVLEPLAKRDYAGAHQAVQAAIGQSANESQTANFQVMDALVYVAEGRSDDAMKALANPNTSEAGGPFARALAAQRKGDMGTARMISYELLGDRRLALTNLNAALARGVAQRIVTGSKR